MAKYVYLISDKNNYTYKIGISKNPKNRLKQLQTGSDKKLVICKQVLCENADQVEASLHHIYSIYNIQGEWFELNDIEIENFEIKCKTIDNDINKIKNNF
jgi:hypothetical protein